MEIVLGLSITGTTARVVLVEGQRADGVTIESEVFDTAAPEGVPMPSPTEQVSNAILATQQNALANGHHLVVSGVTWDGPTQQAELRESMIARGLDDVVLVPEQSAAGALAQTIGRALGYETTAVLVIKLDTATLSIVNCADGSIVEGLPHNFCGANVADVIPEIMASLETIDPQLQGIVIVGSRVETGVVKSRLESLLAVPVIAPEEPELGLARGAALAAASAVGLEAPTAGLAYSQDPDANEVKLSAADTVVSPPLEVDLEDDDDLDSMVARMERAALIPIGSLVAAVCVLGVVALMMSLAFSSGGTTAQNQGLREAEKAAAPSVVVSTPPPAQDPAAVRSPVSVPQAQVLQPPPSSAIPEPIQVAADPPVAAPVITPAPKPAARAPVTKQPAPSRLITEPSPVAAEAPYTEAPIAVQPPPAEAQPIVAPAAALPSVAVGAAACRSRPFPSALADTRAHLSVGAADTADRAFPDPSWTHATRRSTAAAASATIAGLVTAPGAGLVTAPGPGLVTAPGAGLVTAPGTGLVTAPGPGHRPRHRPGHRPRHRPGHRPRRRPGHRPRHRPGHRAAAATVSAGGRGAK